jgi:hypothetical protein
VCTYASNTAICFIRALILAPSKPPVDPFDDELLSLRGEEEEEEDEGGGELCLGAILVVEKVVVTWCTGEYINQGDGKAAKFVELEKPSSLYFGLHLSVPVSAVNNIDSPQSPLRVQISTARF